ncbi:MAG: hypothetical protein ABSB71_08615 [Candidatus Bathyarchaeia archaeon]|jgi:deoxyribodipyrimidine photolyase
MSKEKGQRHVHPAEWEDIVVGVFKYNCLIVKEYVYKSRNVLPKDFEEFKREVLQYVNWHLEATASRLQAEPALEFKAYAESIRKDLPPRFEKVIQDYYKRFLEETTGKKTKP